MSSTENLTIMFTDMVGYTERTARQSRAQNKTMLSEHDRLLLPVLSAFGGNRIKSIGDALLVTFRSPTDAIHCGMALHDTLAEYNSRHGEHEQILIRVSINVGEVRIENRDVYGEAVNVASRVQSITPSGEIYFTEAVYLAMNKAEVSSEAAGEHKLKGIPEAVRVYRVPPRQVNRLVPGGEDLGIAPGELPYNGMHRRIPQRAGLSRLAWPLRLPKLTILRTASAGLRPYSPTLRNGLLVTLLLSIVGYGAWLFESRRTVAPTQAPAGKMLADTGSGKRHLVTAAPPTTSTEASAAARPLLAAAQTAFEKDQRREAVALYEKALALDSTLNEDPQLAGNLVASLSWASDLATPLIRSHAGPAVHAALAQRVLKPGSQGRARAMALLKELGQEQRIDYSAWLALEINDNSTCSTQLEAIERALSAQAALAALPVVSRTMTTCLDAEASRLQAEALLHKYPREPFLTLLAKRATGPSAARRSQAIALLTSLRQTRRIDYGAVSLLDFQEARDCATRVEAAQRLRELSERRALPVLKASLGDGVGAWFGSLCWRNEVSRAIRSIESGSGKASGNKDDGKAP